MFRRLIPVDKDEKAFEPDLMSLGLSVKPDGQIVDASGNHIPDRLHRSARLHDLHAEGIRGGIRYFLARECFARGIENVYLSGDKQGEQGADFAKAKARDRPALPIMTSDIDDMKAKEIVIVLVGENHEDPGVYNYYDVLHDMGIYNATVLGMIDKLNSWAQTEGEPDAHDKAVVEKKIPGLVILNPGQIIYSPGLEKTLTKRSWLSLPLPANQMTPYLLHATDNYTPGHTTAYEHVRTVFKHILPKLLSSKTAICIVGVGDGAGNVLAVLDHLLAFDLDNQLVKQIASLHLMQPTHSHDELGSSELKNLLQMRGQSYVMSEEPVLSLLQGPSDAQTNLTAAAERHSATETIVVDHDDTQLWPNLQATSMPAHAIMHGEIEAYDYKKEKVSCATYSAGPKVKFVGSILPEVLDNVLESIRNWTSASSSPAII